jgi:hypothetical protein
MMTWLEARGGSPAAAGTLQAIAVIAGNDGGYRKPSR